MACQVHCPERPNHVHDDQALRLLADCGSVSGHAPAVEAITAARALVAAARARKEG